MSLSTMLRLSGISTLGRVPARGDRVRHRGTLIWATVLNVVPQRDGTHELLVRPDPHEHFGSDDRSWASYHIDFHVTPEEMMETVAAHPRTCLRCHPDKGAMPQACEEMLRLVREVKSALAIRTAP